MKKFGIFCLLAVCAVALSGYRNYQNPSEALVMRALGGGVLACVAWLIGVIRDKFTKD